MNYRSRRYNDHYINEVNSLTDEEVEKLQIVSDAIAKRYDAEANKESQLKWRILFQRTAPEMLPFVVYCLTFGPVAAYSLTQISMVEGYKFYFLLGALIVIMIIPIFILPRLPFKRLFSKKKETNQ